MSEAGWKERLAEALQRDRYDFALGMSGIGADLKAEGGDEATLVWEAAKVPFFDWCCDHPSLYPVRHAIASRYLLHGYVFPDHARYQAEHLDRSGVAFVAPLGIPSRRLFPGAPRPSSQRNGRLLFAKSGADTNEIEALWRTNPPVIAGVLFECAERLLHRSTTDFLPVIQEAAERQGILLKGSGMLTLWLMRTLDRYVRARRARTVVEALRDHPVDVCGKGWETIDMTGARATVKGPVKWRDIAQAMPDYLGMVSTHPLIEESVHDRVFFALASGTVPVSESNAFSRARLPELEAYAFGFRHEEIVAAAERVLADPDEALERTERTHGALLPEFGLDQTARRILQYVRLSKFNEAAADTDW